MRVIRTLTFLAFAAWTLLGAPRLPAQAALLMEEPYGFYGTMNPTGHSAIYLARVCADTPLTLRRCMPGETGVVISRYQGINGYDWVALPLVPYLYAVDTAADVPAHVDHEIVTRLRDHYHEAHLMSLGTNLKEGNITHGGWGQMVGIAYDRRIYAFRFETTPEQDDALIAMLNDRKNHSHFNMFYNNCADFGRLVLNSYFPHKFRRGVFPDVGISTPKELAIALAHYAKKHPDLQMTVLEIPQVPGYERLHRSNNGVAESLFTTGYAAPLAVVNPYLAGGIFVDFLVRGHASLIPKHPPALAPDNLFALTETAGSTQNPNSAGAEAASAAASGSAETQPAVTANSGLVEVKATHE